MRESLVNLWEEAETTLKMKTMNVVGGTFTSGPKYGTWVNGFNKQKKIVSSLSVCVK